MCKAVRRPLAAGRRLFSQTLPSTLSHGPLTDRASHFAPVTCCLERALATAHPEAPWHAFIPASALACYGMAQPPSPPALPWPCCTVLLTPLYCNNLRQHLRQSVRGVGGSLHVCVVGEGADPCHTSPQVGSAAALRAHSLGAVMRLHHAKMRRKDAQRGPGILGAGPPPRAAEEGSSARLGASGSACAQATPQRLCQKVACLWFKTAALTPGWSPGVLSGGAGATFVLCGVLQHKACGAARRALAGSPWMHPAGAVDGSPWYLGIA